MFIEDSVVDQFADVKDETIKSLYAENEKLKTETKLLTQSKVSTILSVLIFIPSLTYFEGINIQKRQL